MATTIDTKPAAGLFGGAVSIIALGLLNRYTGFHPTVEEGTAITTVVGFAVAWAVPSRLWAKAEASLPEVDMMESSPEVQAPTVSVPSGTTMTDLTAPPAAVVTAAKPAAKKAAAAAS